MFRCKKLTNCLNKLNLIEILLLLLLVWASLWPLMFPNWRTDGYRQISDNNIESDLSTCQLTSDQNKNVMSQPDKPQCPAFAPNLGIISD